MSNHHLTDAEMHIAARTVRNEWTRMQRFCPYRETHDAVAGCGHEENAMWTKDCEVEVCPFVQKNNQGETSA